MFFELKACLDAVQMQWTSHVITFNPRRPFGPELALQRSDRGVINWDVPSLSLPMSTGEKVFLATTKGQRIAFTSYEQDMQSVFREACIFSPFLHAD